MDGWIATMIHPSFENLIKSVFVPTFCLIFLRAKPNKNQKKKAPRLVQVWRPSIVPQHPRMLPSNYLHVIRSALAFYTPNASLPSSCSPKIS